MPVVMVEISCPREFGKSTIKVFDICMVDFLIVVRELFNKGPRYEREEAHDIDIENIPRSCDGEADAKDDVLKLELELLHGRKVGMRKLGNSNDLGVVGVIAGVAVIHVSLLPKPPGSPFTLKVEAFEGALLVIELAFAFAMMKVRRMTNKEAYLRYSSMVGC